MYIHARYDSINESIKDESLDKTGSSSWKSPNQLAPSSGYKNEIEIRPDSRSCKVLRARAWGKRN